MFDYAPLSTGAKSLIQYILIIFILFNLSCQCRHESNPKNFSLRSILKSSHHTKRLLRIVYIREIDLNLEDTRLQNDIKNVTDFYDIDFKLHIFDQSTPLLITKLCTLIAEERRDTIFLTDLYTKEIDLISRSFQIPTIATTNRYSMVQGKLHNPYLFKFMPDPLEEAQSMAYALDTRSVYSRIALIYDNSLDMVEYRFSYLRIAKQHIIYQAQIPRVSDQYELHHSARKIITDLTRINIDLILCVLSTERESQFIRLIKRLSTDSERHILLNQTKWWFASRLDDIRNATYFPKIYTANEDRRRLLSHFSITVMKILLNAILKAYTRLPLSSAFMSPTSCGIQQNTYQLQKTQMFIQLFTNFTEWNCDIRIGLSIDPILFDPKTLVWRVPTIFTVHTEDSCQGMLTRIFYTLNSNADQLFRSCRSSHLTSRRPSSSSQQQDNSSTVASSNAIADIKNYHQMIGRLTSDGSSQCQYLHIQNPLRTLIIVGVVEPPYIFISDAEMSSEFHCNYGIPCYQIDPLLINFTTDALFFHRKMDKRPHCCYGISVNLFLRLEDSKLVQSLKTTSLFVFADKPNKWLALIHTLQNHRAHLSITALPYESFLGRSLDLTPPFYHSSYVILTVPAPTGPSLGAFLQPFSWATWFMIFLLLNATALFETFFEWHSPYGLTPKGRRRNKVFSLASALTLSWSVLFSHTFKTKSPKCWSNRFLGNVWGGFGIVFIAIYTAKIAAFMVEMGRAHTASNIQDIVEACRNLPRCTVGVIANTSDEEYLKRFYLSTLYPHVHYVSSYSQGIDLLREYRITYLLMDQSMARYYLTRDVYKLIQISEDSFGRFGLSLAFSKSAADLKENITNILLSYVDKGIIQRLHDDWYVYENCETKLLDQNHKLSVDRFVGVFILLLAGILAGFIVLILEWLVFKYAVPFCRKRQWTGGLYCSQRLYAILNVPNDIYNEVYCPSRNYSFRCIGERLHNYSNRTDSLDLNVFNVPKLLTTTCQLKEQISQISEQNQQSPLLTPNGDIQLKDEHSDNKQSIRKRIDELECELNYLKSQLKTNFISDNP